MKQKLKGLTLPDIKINHVIVIENSKNWWKRIKKQSQATEHAFFLSTLPYTQAHTHVHTRIHTEGKKGVREKFWG